MKKSINPYTGELLYEFEELSAKGIDQKLEAAENSFQKWRKTTLDERATLMRKAAKILKGSAPEYGRTITLEMGKPISQAVAEVEKCAWVCEYYAEHAGAHLADEVVETDADLSLVRYEPLGAILAVMPWNFPFWQVFRFAAPALMAGNVGLLKHASNVFKCAENIENIFLKAGFPEGCFQSLALGSDRIEELLKNRIVKAATLTGSKPAGASVASLAGAQIKKSVLELGGSNALLVFDDADLLPAIDTCVQARFQNTGQSCIAGKRLLVQKGISNSFVRKLKEEVEKLKSGDPLNEDTYIGVLAREDLARELERQVSESVEQGARILTGGKRKGAYYAPTLVTGVTPEMPMFREETFGPALGITVFESEEDGVALANDSEFGLGVSVFTSDRDRAERLVPEFDEGAVFVNEMVKSDPRLPFGGVKTSGYGRELSGHGIQEFVNKKTVYYHF
jgi:succinate-semialdehyde dehydrogenase / glutarate-semialdehyde dehydrogenase